MIADTTIKRPALRYYGGKWNLAPWIISHFPPHKNYVEPCGGAASVLLQKPRSPLETYNDLDGNVVNFFRVLRDRPDELIRKIRLTPWAREEFELSLIKSGDDIEDARRFYVCLRMGARLSYNTTMGQVSFMADRNLSGVIPILFFDDLVKIADRFVSVQIEKLDFTVCVPKYDNDSTLFYCDPPYPESERAQFNIYLQEWSDAQHVEAADLLRACAGYVVISGYACPLYTELYEAYGWQRFDKEAQTNSGGKRIESLWLSPRTVKALNIPRQISMKL